MNFYSKFSKNEKDILLLVSYYKEHGGEIIDSHVHPADVMSVFHFDDHEYFDKQIEERSLLKLSLIEKLKYGRIVNLLADSYCKFFPNQVNNEIKEKYSLISEGRLVKEMRLSMVDKSVLVPLEPTAPFELINRNFSNKRFYFLGSIDIHNIKLDEIKKVIYKFSLDKKIKGIKMHPNLQNFYPIPSDNPESLSEKLGLVYSLCEKYKMYILFHAGKQFFTNRIDRRYKNFSRSKSKALLKNFYYKNGESLFSRYNIPFVLAHLGHYGISKIQDEQIRNLNKNDNVYFDNSGTSPRLIYEMLNIVGSKKIMFGSDAIYNRQIINAIFLASAVYKKFDKKFIEELHKVFYQNFNAITLNRL